VTELRDLVASPACEKFAELLLSVLDLTPNDLEELRDRANKMCFRNTFCRVLYRNKSPEYFSNMFTKHAGVMEVYEKDNSGDPASSINGQIEGLSYCGTVLQ